MAHFYLWNPSLCEPDSSIVSMFLTPASLDTVASGTKWFAMQLLDDARIAASPRNWTIRTIRSSYFCDYPDTGDWEDLWPDGWEVTIAVDRAVQLPHYVREWTATFADDDSVTADALGTEHERFVCMVMASFGTTAALQEAARELRARIAPQASWRILQRKWRGRFPQLCVDLGGQPSDFFSSGAQVARELEELLARAGGRVRCEED